MDRLLAMEAFVRTVDTGSMSRAASQLGIANASVTTLTRKLEAYLGVTLLQRSTRYVRLTEEGAKYYERCRSILDQIGEAEAALTERERGEIRLETPIAVGHLVLGPALAKFSVLHPELRVVTTLSNEVDNLIKRGMDVAIRMEAVESGELVARLIYRARYVLCAAPGFLQQHGEPGTPAEIVPKQCLGFAGSPSGDLRIWHFSRGELVRLLPDWETEEQTFYAVYLRTRFTPPKVRALVDFLASHFGVQSSSAPVPIRAR